MILLLVLPLWSATPSDMLEQALQGRPGSRWSGTAMVERPGPDHRTDTARVCREGTAERLDFREGAFWTAGDSMVFLHPQDRTAWAHARRPPPPMPEARLVGTDRVLGRNVLVLEAKAPWGGRGRKMWVDTSLPAVLKGEAVGEERRGPDRQFLSIRPGQGCPPGSFQLPSGWTWREGPPPPPEPQGDDARRHGRRHESANLAELSRSVGFEPPPPPWMPAGFQTRSYGWVETREGPAAQILYSDGSRNVSIFWRPLGGPPPFCPAGGCKDHQGRPVVFGSYGKLGLAVTGDLPPEDLERVAGIRK